MGRWTRPRPAGPKGGGNPFGELAKLGQLFRIARFPWKLRYYIDAWLMFFAALRRWRSTESYFASIEPLLYTLRRTPMNWVGQRLPVAFGERA
jgi:hypothetical protein